MMKFLKFTKELFVPVGVRQAAWGGPPYLGLRKMLRPDPLGSTMLLSLSRLFPACPCILYRKPHVGAQGRGLSSLV
jgi:hypothetical protein